MSKQSEKSNIEEDDIDAKLREEQVRRFERIWNTLATGYQILGNKAGLDVLDKLGKSDNDTILTLSDLVEYASMDGRCSVLKEEDCSVKIKDLTDNELLILQATLGRVIGESSPLTAIVLGKLLSIIDNEQESRIKKA